MTEELEFMQIISGGPTGWQIELDAFKRGSGSYWVPDPVFGLTLQQMDILRNKAIQFRDSIMSRLGEFKSGANTGPMNDLITLLNQKVYLYESAIHDLGGQNVEQPVTSGKESDVVVPPSPPAEENEVMSFVKKNAIPLSIAAFFLINALLPRNKKILKF